MLKRTLCKVEFTWALSCKGPLLIRDERYEAPGTAKEGFPQCIFISRASKDRIKQESKKWKEPMTRLSFYVPGTSIRGPFRAQAERIIRTLCDANAFPPYTACDPFQEKEAPGLLHSCSKRLENVDETNPPYARACPACRIFGCAGLASRIVFADADIAKGYASVYRDMIGIDRFTGGVSPQANMKLHVLENTKFETTVTITNFELWHVGLMAYIFQDFKDGLVSIGYGKTKGFGQVRGEVKEIKLTYSRASNRIEHMGSLMSAEERVNYDVTQAEAKAFEGLEDHETGGLSWYQSRRVKPDRIGAFFEIVADSFNSYINAIKKEAA